jgi:hypothetical protein
MSAKTVTERPRFMMTVAVTVVVCMLAMIKYCVPNATWAGLPDGIFSNQNSILECFAMKDVGKF